MCLIAVKSKGKYAYSDLFIDALVTASKTNSDGIGYAYKRDGETSVHYEKGLTEIRPFIDKLIQLDIKDKDELIVHLRRCSSGSKGVANCHPFVLSPVESNISSPGPCMTYNSVLFHNGHLTSFSDVEKINSDTYMLAKLFFRNRDILDLLYKDKNQFLQCFSGLLHPEKNRIAIMSNSRERNISLIGGFIEDQGYLFSNISYKDSKIIDTGGSSIKKGLSTAHPIKGFSLTPKNKELDSINDRLANLVANNTEVPKVRINANNFFELTLQAKKDLENGVKEGSLWNITKWDDKSKYLQLLTDFNNPSIFAWIDMMSLRDDFTPIPKLAFMRKYKDYYRICQLIIPTKSAIKKIHNKVNTLASRKGKWPDGDILVDIKYRNRPFALRYDAICMFIRDNINFLDGYANIPTTTKQLIEQVEFSIDKNTEVVNKLKEFKKIKEAAAETIKSKDEAISEEIRKNEEIVKKSLEDWKTRDINKETNKVDSNNGEEENPQEERELGFVDNIPVSGVMSPEGNVNLINKEGNIIEDLAKEGLSRCNI